MQDCDLESQLEMLRRWKEERQVFGLQVAVQLVEGGEAQVVEAVYRIIGLHLITHTLQAQGEHCTDTMPHSTTHTSSLARNLPGVSTREQELVLRILAGYRHLPPLAEECGWAELVPPILAIVKQRYRQTSPGRGGATAPAGMVQWADMAS